MNEAIAQVAQRIKELRRISDKSTTEIAGALSISTELYESYESGTVDIPASMLYAIAGLHKVDLTTLLTGEEPRLHVYTLVRKDKGVSVDRRQDYKYQHLAYNFIHKKAEPFLVQVDPEDETEPVHLNSHVGQEFDYLLEGRLTISINGKVVTLEEGDSIFYDSSYPHGMKALGGKSARFLAVIL